MNNAVTSVPAQLDSEFENIISLFSNAININHGIIEEIDYRFKRIRNNQQEAKTNEQSAGQSKEAITYTDKLYVLLDQLRNVNQLGESVLSQTNGLV